MNSLVLVALKARDNRMLLPLFLGAVQTLLSRGCQEWPSAFPPSLPSRADPGQLPWNQLWASVGASRGIQGIQGYPGASRGIQRHPGSSRGIQGIQGAALFGGLTLGNSHLGNAWLLFFSKLFLCSRFLPLICCKVGQSF